MLREKTSYKAIYEKMEKSGIIDKMIIQDNICQVDIIKGIEYLSDFIGSNTFTGMKYRFNNNDGVTKVCKEYAKLRIKENNTRFTKEYQYMIDTHC